MNYEFMSTLILQFQGLNCCEIQSSVSKPLSLTGTVLYTNTTMKIISYKCMA